MIAFSTSINVFSKTQGTKCHSKTKRKHHPPWYGAYRHSCSVALMDAQYVPVQNLSNFYFIYLFIFWFLRQGLSVDLASLQLTT